MSTKKTSMPAGVRHLKVTVPAEVAEYYEKRATTYATSLSAAVSPVLCAQARGEILQHFTQQGGSDVMRPR